MTKVMNRKVLYSREEADFLSEKERKVHDQQKTDVILGQIDHADSLMEIGCGSGQILKDLVNRIPYVVGVDESADRLRHAAQTCPGVKLIKAKAEELEFKEEFDVVLTSQMLHEVKMFGTKKEMERILFVIWRALKPGGKYLLLDHLDPGKGLVKIKIPDSTEKLLYEFAAKFSYRPVYLKKLSKGKYKISKRDLQDFVTKTWSLNSPMETMEMNETHASFSEKEAKKITQNAGFSIKQFITFTNIEGDLKLHNISLEGKTDPWNRKFMLVASKP